MGFNVELELKNFAPAELLFPSTYFLTMRILNIEMVTPNDLQPLNVIPCWIFIT